MEPYKLEKGLYIIPLNKNLANYKAIIEVREKCYEITIEIDKNEFKSSKFYCDIDLKNLVKNCEEKLTTLVEKYNKIEDVIFQFRIYLIEHVQESEFLPNTEQCVRILKDIQEIEHTNISNISKDMSQIELFAYDNNERKHAIHFTITKNYPDEFPKIQTELPLPFKPINDGQKNKILSSFTQFKNILPMFYQFWDEVDELKDNAIILEPELPNYANTEYRIALGAKASLHISIDPQQVENPPECQFLGPDGNKLEEIFIQNIDNWNEELSLLQNLQRIIEVEFPSKKSNGEIDLSLACGICYSFRLQKEIPDQYCPEKRCAQVYHHECLLQWIKSIPGSKQSFQTLFGECPYCNSTITMNISNVKS